MGGAGAGLGQWYLAEQFGRAHFGITCAQVSLTFVFAHKMPAVMPGTGWDMAGSYGRPAHQDVPAPSSPRLLAGEQQLVEVRPGGLEADLAAGQLLQQRAEVPGGQVSVAGTEDAQFVELVLVVEVE